ncbi:MAG: CPBP family glutamic-type intramembrane protease [Acidimicrobiales bacterium]
MSLPGSSFPSGPPTAPPAGWYPDPTNQRWMWWDGARWFVPEPAPESSTWFPAIPTLALPAAVLGISFVVAFTVVSRLATVLTGTVGMVVALALLAVDSIGMPLVAWLSSMRYGTRKFAHDLGFRVRWIDVPLGIAGAIVLTITIIIVSLTFRALGVPHGSNLTDVADRGRDGFLFLMLFVLAGIVAPVTEELMFRGVIFRGLSSRWSSWAAVGLQALVFGAAHFTPDQGWGNVDLIVSLALMGAGLGALAKATGRLGAGMIAHSTFNCMQLGLLWLTLK